MMVEEAGEAAQSSSLLLQLPAELGLMVLEYLNPRDVCLSFAPTCRQALNLHDQPLLWTTFHKRLMVEEYANTGDVGEDSDVSSMLTISEEEEERQRTLKSRTKEQLEKEQRERWEHTWLLHAGMTVGEALAHSYPVDWKTEYIRRITFSVLVIAHHGAHGSSYRYDISACKQLKKGGLHRLSLCHPDCDSHRFESASSPEQNGGFKCIRFSSEAAKGHSSILLFFATAPSEQNAAKLGDLLYEHLKSGGGVVLCCYAYLNENRLLGKWATHFYPMPSSSFSEPIRPGQELKPFLGEHDSAHPIMNGITNVRIESGRDTARCKTLPRPGAKVIARYADGPPLVVLYDSDANKANAELANVDRGKPADSDSVSTTEWGKTVFLNFFPVSNEEARLGGWYPPAPQSDIPRLLYNALSYVSRKD